MTSCGTIILSAGRSARMGYPKALIVFSGRLLVQHLHGIYRGLGPVWVTVNGGLEDSLAALSPPLDLVVNLRPKDGLFSSVRLGIQAARGQVESLLVTPVDCLLPDDHVPRLLATRAPHGSKEVLVPTCNGRPGHPVLLHHTRFDEILAFPPTSIFSQVLEQLGTTEVEVGDEWILTNINTRPDYERARAKFEGKEES